MKNRNLQDTVKNTGLAGLAAAVVACSPGFSGEAKDSHIKQDKIIAKIAVGPEQITEKDAAGRIIRENYFLPGREEITVYNRNEKGHITSTAHYVNGVLESSWSYVNNREGQILRATHHKKDGTEEVFKLYEQQEFAVN